MSRIGRFQIALLKKSTIVALLCLMCLLLAKVDVSAAPAKNVILMISDGQGYNTVQATNYYTGLTQVYETFPTQYGVTTYMLLSNGTPWGYDSAAAWSDFNYVKSNPTDSAAAATAIYTGEKTYGGSIGMDFDREALVSIAQMAATYGKATGAVSSVQFSHATPAAVAALMYVFEVATAVAGWLYHIEPFNQPGVEESKRFTQALMGREGLEEVKKEIDEHTEGRDAGLLIRI